MKKLLAFAALFAVVALTSCKYDDDDLWNSVHGLENRVAKLEELCKQMNTNISSLYGHEIEMYTVEQGEKRDKRQ